MMIDRPRSDGDQRVVVGRASTDGQALPLGVDDPVIAARAVRRALADAHRRATEVDILSVATPPPLTQEAVARFARRALGPRGAEVGSCATESLETDARSLVELAARALPGGERASGLGVAVGVAPDGTTIAICLDAQGGER